MTGKYNPTADEIEYPAEIEIKKPAGKKPLQPSPAKSLSDEVEVVSLVSGLFDDQGNRHDIDAKFTATRATADILKSRNQIRFA